METSENGSATSCELGRPHPEERACGRGFANSNGRARVSKTEDDHALMRRDAPQRTWAMEASSLGFRCDAPQHEGEGHRILAKRTQRAFWPSGSSPRKRGRMITAAGHGSLSPRSAGTTIAWCERRTNLRLHEMTAGVISLFPVVIYNEVCNSHVPAALSAQDFACSLPRPSHRTGRRSIRAVLRRRVEQLPVLVRLLPCQGNRGGRMQRCSSCDSSIGTHRFL